MAMNQSMIEVSHATPRALQLPAGGQDVNGRFHLSRLAMPLPIIKVSHERDGGGNVDVTNNDHFELGPWPS